VLCKKAGLAISPSLRQSCRVAEWHYIAKSEQRFAETKSCPFYHCLLLLLFF